LYACGLASYYAQSMSPPLTYGSRGLGFDVIAGVILGLAIFMTVLLVTVLLGGVTPWVTLALGVLETAIGVVAFRRSPRVLTRGIAAGVAAAGVLAVPIALALPA
jgi:hypothetical protein